MESERKKSKKKQRISSISTVSNCNLCTNTERKQVLIADCHRRLGIIYSIFLLVAGLESVLMCCCVCVFADVENEKNSTKNNIFCVAGLDIPIDFVLFSLPLLCSFDSFQTVLIIARLHSTKRIRKNEKKRF